MNTRRALAVLTTVTGLGLMSLPAAPGAPAQPRTADPAGTALDWQSTALVTVPFSPAQALYLGFTSRAVERAVARSLRRATSSEPAAVARAAHDVLVEYFPGSAPGLDAQLDASLAAVADGAAKTRGTTLGARAAAAIIHRRAHDGRDDLSIVFDQEPGIGVWRDERPMITPWLGFVTKVVGGRRVRVGGPDPVGSARYRADLAEVQRDGRAGGDPEKAATATFFNVPGIALYRNALIAHLRQQPIGLKATTSLFADLDLATAEAMRQTWWLKYREGFWRPSAAITSDDGDPRTTPEEGWTPVLPVPAYPDYPSGHGTLTAAFAKTVRCHLGDITLTLVGAGPAREYTRLADLERAALLSRIYGGLHFRTAMTDAYRVGHSVAARVSDC